MAVDHGFEGRVWRNHALVASQWWPESPSLAEWNAFLRGSGLAPAGRVPDAAPGGLAEFPWSAPRAFAVSELATRHRTTMVAVGAGLLLAILAMPLVAAISLEVAIWQVDNEIASQDANLQRILDAREQAGRDAAAIESYLGMRPPAGQLELLSTVVEMLPDTGWRMLEWRMEDADNLEVDLSMARPDPTALVQLWEGSERFEGVTVELGRSPDEVTVKAGIVGANERAAAPGAAGATP